jgi:uncharacterized protein YtpQ (UPF0354 family)
MQPTSWKPFVHPHSVYRLEYPGHWEHVNEKDGASCGFGPHDRNDVGLWISIMPMSVDTDKLVEALPGLMQQALEKADAKDLRPDPTLRHYGLVADMVKDGQGGHYWILTGGDVVLFASSQVPVAERDVWNPPFQRLMASLQITRDQQLIDRKVVNEVMAQLRKQYPEDEFTLEDDRIRGPNQVVYLGNLCREVRGATAKRRDEIITRFVSTLTQPATAEIGQETWESAQGRILPLLKPRNYIDPSGPTQHLLTSEWLVDVVICYAIKSKRMYRFVTGWDVDRWGTDATALHDRAIANLAALSWPRQLMGSRTKDSGRVIVVDTDDGLASSRLLHPDLHQLFSGPLGSPFWAGIPCRDRLVVYSDRKALKQRIGRRLAKDHDTSAYPITPKPFLVTRDGIALVGDK